MLITFSAGVAQYQPGELQENIFKRADQAMYKAKKTGKNQILAADKFLSTAELKWSPATVQPESRIKL